MHLNFCPVATGSTTHFKRGGALFIVSLGPPIWLGWGEKFWILGDVGVQEMVFGLCNQNNVVVFKFCKKSVVFPVQSPFTFWFIDCIISYAFLLVDKYFYVYLISVYVNCFTNKEFWNNFHCMTFWVVWGITATSHFSRILNIWAAIPRGTNGATPEYPPHLKCCQPIP